MGKRMDNHCVYKLSQLEIIFICHSSRNLNCMDLFHPMTMYQQTEHIHLKEKQYKSPYDQYFSLNTQRHFCLIHHIGNKLL